MPAEMPVPSPSSRVSTWFASFQTGATTLVAVVGAYFLWQLNQTQAELNTAQASLKDVEKQVAQQQQVRVLTGLFTEFPRRT